jgi:iron complex outermembrane recepter protein
LEFVVPILNYQPGIARLFLAVISLSPLLAVAADPMLPTVEVSADAERQELAPQSIRNPYRVEVTAQAGTEVMTREDIDALSPKDTIDLLDKAVGMNMTYQGRRSPYFFDQRGGGSMTFILDGAVLPTSFNRILQSIPLAAIEQIEIVRGATSLALGPTIPIGSSNSGSGVNTGFVVIRTRRASQSEGEASGFVEKAKSQPTANGESLYLGTRLGGLDALSGHLGATVSRRDLPANDERFDGQETKAGMLSGGTSISGFSANLTAFKSDSRFEMQRGVTTDGSLDDAKWYYDPLQITLIAANMGMAWSDDQVTLLSVFATDYEQTEHNEYFSGVAPLAEREFKEKTRGFNLRHNARYASDFGDTLLQFGLQRTGSEGFGANTNKPYNDWKTRVTGWSASLEQSLLDKRLVADIGYRSDRKYIDRSTNKASLVDANSDTDLAPARTFSLGARWLIDDAYTLSGRYFDGHESTSGDFDLVTQSGEALHATEQKRSELVLEAAWQPYIRPALTWFDVDIKNQKRASSNTYVVDGETYYYYTESDSHQRGLELLVKGRVAGRTTYQVAWTHLTDNETTSGGVTTDSLDVTAPSDIYSARLTHAWDDYRFNFSYKRVSGWSESRSPRGTVTGLDLGDYNRIDANIVRDFTYRGLQFSAKLYGRNINDDQYATRYTTGYYYDRGRTFGLELASRF